MQLFFPEPLELENFLTPRGRGKKIISQSPSREKPVKPVKPVLNHRAVSQKNRREKPTGGASRGGRRGKRCRTEASLFILDVATGPALVHRAHMQCKDRATAVEVSAGVAKRFLVRFRASWLMQRNRQNYALYSLGWLMQRTMSTGAWSAAPD